MIARTDTYRLESVNPQEVAFTAREGDPRRTDGFQGYLSMRRVFWEASGRPVDLELTMGTDERDPATHVLSEIAAERQDQHSRGYTPAHDDAHGLGHILAQTATTPMDADRAAQRAGLIRDAALLVAAIEWIDRNPGK